MMDTETLGRFLARAETKAWRAAETAATVHQDDPGSVYEADALDDLVLALREREMWQQHLNVAAAEGAVTGGAA